MVRKSYRLKNLDCAACAAKIEHKVNQSAPDGAIAVNFAALKLVVEAETAEQAETLLFFTRKTIQELEPGVEILPEDEPCGEHGCSCGHDHSHGAEPESIKKQVIWLIAGAVLFAAGALVKWLLPETGVLSLALLAVSYLIIGGPVLLRAVRNITKGQVFDENFLMSIASLGAFVIGESIEGVAVMLFYQVGELFQDLAVNRSRKSIAALMDIKPEFANLLQDGTFVKADPASVHPDDLIVVRPGEKVPLDGVVVEGVSELDTSALTGESLPTAVEPGSEVLSGSINTAGALTLRVTKEYKDSTVARILDLVENTSGKKAETEHFITKFARIYTPCVVGLAVLIMAVPPLLIPGEAFADWFYRALIFLVMSCPCALVISVPLTFFGGIGGASKLGILVKGGNYMEALARAETVVFDKTGTLTEGKFAVEQIIPANGPEEELLELCAYAEGLSTHPIGKSIVERYGKEIDAGRLAEYEEIAGQGVSVLIDGRRVLAGSAKLMKNNGISVPEQTEAGTVIYTAAEGVYLGRILIGDQIKQDAAKAVEDLQALGIKDTVMLTGDNEKTARKVGEKIGIHRIYAHLLPADKAAKLEELLKGKTKKRTVLFVGDGINDAPVLAGADVGIAMGGVGSDAAVNAADVILMRDEPSKVAVSIRVARKTLRIVKQNIIFAIAVKFAVLLLGIFGFATMWEAVFADVGVCLIAILNAVRMLRIKQFQN